MLEGSNGTPACDGAPTHRPKIGEPFDPWRKICGFYPPDIVGKQRDLTDGQKRQYERAVRWAGKNATFWRGFESMADALGKSIRQVKARALESKSLITHIRRLDLLESQARLDRVSLLERIMEAALEALSTEELELLSGMARRNASASETPEEKDAADHYA